MILTGLEDIQVVGEDIKNIDLMEETHENGAFKDSNWIVTMTKR